MPLKSVFHYDRQSLMAEEVPLREIALAVGTPTYVYSRRQILESLQVFDKAFAAVPHLICFALKANANRALVHLLAKAGAGADIVSGGELYRAREAGVPAARIVFSGVGKTSEEIRAALQEGVRLLIAESLEEIEEINRIAGELHTRAPLAVRVNPDVDASTHRHITTGVRESKFGIPMAQTEAVVQRVRTLAHVEWMGLHAHVGSQITTPRPFVTTLRKLMLLVKQLGHQGVRLRYLDLGGGLGVTYKDEKPPTPAALARVLIPLLKGKSPTRHSRTGDGAGLTLIFEPGRFLVGPAGVLLTRVLYRKDVGHKHFIVVDAGMNDLARPALYDAFHQIRPVIDGTGPEITADVVGPVCESGDYLARNRRLRLPQQGEFLAVETAGAYGFSMASQYNSRPRAAEVLVDDERWYVIRQRESYEDLVRGETIPEELQ